MTAYLPDTNVLIDYGRFPVVQAKLDSAEKSGATFVLAPVTLTELIVGVVNGGPAFFQRNKRIFPWLLAHSGSILDLPAPFIGKLMGFSWKRSRVEPIHYLECIKLVVNSGTFEEFLRRKDDAGSSWTDIDRAFQIHNRKVDEEFSALERLAAYSKEKVDVAKGLCKGYTPPSIVPDADLFKRHFSAAIEYAEASIALMRESLTSTTRVKANPRKNDRGRYGDFQLFVYLADPNITLLTGEEKRFLRNIEHSPQRTRIVSLDAL